VNNCELNAVLWLPANISVDLSDYRNCMLLYDSAISKGEGLHDLCGGEDDETLRTEKR
jgi:hypothetical protein